MSFTTKTLSSQIEAITLKMCLTRRMTLNLFGEKAKLEIMVPKEEKLTPGPPEQMSHYS